MQIIVKKVYEEREPAQMGDTEVTIFCWVMDVLAAGKLIEKAKVKVFSKGQCKVPWIGKVGAVVETEAPKDYQGTAEIKVIAPKQENGWTNKEPRFEGEGAGKETRPASPSNYCARTGYTHAEFDGLFRLAGVRAKDTLDVLYPEYTADNLCSLLATYLIGAQKEGIKVVPAETVKPKDEPPKAKPPRVTPPDSDNIPF